MSVAAAAAGRRMAASASISTSIAGSMSRFTSTIVVAGRIAPNISRVRAPDRLPLPDVGHINARANDVARRRARLRECRSDVRERLFRLRVRVADADEPAVRPRSQSSRTPRSDGQPAPRASSRRSVPMVCRWRSLRGSSSRLRGCPASRSSAPCARSASARRPARAAGKCREVDVAQGPWLRQRFRHRSAHVAPSEAVAHDERCNRRASGAARHDRSRASRPRRPETPSAAALTSALGILALRARGLRGRSHHDDEIALAMAVKDARKESALDGKPAKRLSAGCSAGVFTVAITPTRSSPAACSRCRRRRD